MPIILLLAGTALFLFVGAKAYAGTPGGELGGGSVNPALAKPPAYPNWFDYDALFQANAGPYPWGWLKAIAIVESTLGNNSLVKTRQLSSDGKSKGLMQLILKTAHALDPAINSLDQLDDDSTSVRLAGMLVNQLFHQFGGDPESIFRAYNGGPHFGAATIPYWLKIQDALALIDSYQPGIT